MRCVVRRFGTLHFGELLGIRDGVATVRLEGAQAVSICLADLIVAGGGLEPADIQLEAVLDVRPPPDRERRASR